MPQPVRVERIHLALSVLPLFRLSVQKTNPSAGTGGLTFLLHGIAWTKEDLRGRLATITLPPSIGDVAVREGNAASSLILSIQLKGGGGEPDTAGILELVGLVAAHALRG